MPGEVRLKRMQATGKPGFGHFFLRGLAAGVYWPLAQQPFPRARWAAQTSEGRERPGLVEETPVGVTCTPPLECNTQLCFYSRSQRQTCTSISRAEPVYLSWVLADSCWRCPRLQRAPGGAKCSNKQVIFLPLFYRLPCRGVSKWHADKGNAVTKGGN